MELDFSLYKIRIILAQELINITTNNLTDCTKNIYRKHFIIFIFGFLAVSSLIYSDAIIDYFLLPRFITTSLTVFVLSIMILFCNNNGKGFCNSKILIIPFGFYIFNLLSVLWSLNKAEALFESQRIFLWLAVMALVVYFMNYNKFDVFIYRIIPFIALFVIYIAISQYVDLPDKERSTLYKVTALSGHKNLLSSFLFLLMPFLIINVLKEKPFWKVISFICLISEVILILLLQTRSVYLGLFSVIILSVVILCLKRMQLGTLKKLYGIVFILILPLLVILSVYLMYEFVLFNDESIKERYLLLEKTFSMIKNNFITGVGAGNWQVFFPAYGLEGLEDKVLIHNISYQRPHNDFLWVFSENGIIGFVIYAGIYLYCVFSSLSRMLKMKECIRNFESWILPLFLFGYVIISFFDFPKERIEHNILSAAILGLIIFSMKGFEIKNFRNIKILNYSMLILFVFSSIFNIVLGIQRYYGELNMKIINEAKSAENWKNVIAYSNNSSSFFYNLDNNSMPVMWYKGNAEYSLGLYKEASDSYLSAYNISPFNIYVINNYASSLLLEGKIDEAKELYYKALSISPAFDEPKFNLASIAYKEKDVKKAIEFLEKTNSDSLRKTKYLNLILEKSKNDK